MKFITCRVAKENRSRFSKAQQSWSALANVQGFVAQTGGWSAGDPNCAVIVSYWENPSVYTAFMCNVHDVIFKSNGQEETYCEIAATLFEDVFDMPGACSTIAKAVSVAKYIRLADGRVKPDRIDHFREVQETVWKPAMAKTAGMLGGLFTRAVEDRERFLVATMWESEEAHTRYRRDVFPALRERAMCDDDCRLIDGTLVSVERSWRVVSA